jgi:hypothetical protein
MYVTPRQRRNYFWTTLILLLGLPLTVFAAISAIRYFSDASADVSPKNVIISNVSANSISVTWITESESAGSISVNSGKGDSAPFIDIRGTDRRFTHHVDIVDLEPSKDYSFVILSNDTRYNDEKGKSFKFRTASVTSQTPVPKPVYGSLDGSDIKDALVYITLKGKDTVYPASSATTATGKWIIDLSSLRDPTKNTLVSTDPNTEISITVKGVGTLGGSISGTYSEIIDNEGQLKTPILLSDVPTASLFADFPKISMISSITQVVTAPPVETPTTPETPVIPDEEEVIATDVKWSAIPGTNSVSASTSVTGEKSVKITNLTDSGFNIVWLTQTAQEGSIKYGTTASDLSQTGLDERDSAVSKGKYTAHSVKVTRLLAETKYFFEIYSDATVIKNNNVPFEVTTFKTLAAPPEFKTITGNIKNVSSAMDTVVLVTLKDVDANGTTGVSTISSTIPDATGAWVATIGDVRNSTGTEYFSFSDTDTVTTNALSLSTVPAVSKTTKASIEGETTLSASSKTSGKVVKIASLANYGVYAASTPSTNNLGTGSGGGSSTEYIPKTAISTPLIYTIIFGIISILAGSAIYIRSNGKYRDNKNKTGMISSVN